MTPVSQNVKPDSILHELSQLWGNTQKTGREPTNPGANSEVIRACAMTLIVFVDDEHDASVLDKTLKEVIRVHPSRALVVRLKEDPGSLESRVLVQCWKPAGHQRQICCEQVELFVSMDRVADLPTIIDPLTAADVPRVIWFNSTRLERAPDISALLTLGDKIIVDSSRPGSPAFADMRVLSGAGFTVADLSWTRLTRLRELLAQLLSERDLASVRNALISYCGSEPAPEARYMQAWLRSELPGASINLRRENFQGGGRITSVEIEPDLNLRVSSTCAEYQSGALHQRANLIECAEHELLSEELGIMTRDPAFERALQRMTIWNPRS